MADKKEQLKNTEYYRNQIDGSFVLKFRHFASENYYTPVSMKFICDTTGVSKNVMYRLNTGKGTQNVELATVFSICDKLGVSPFAFAKPELRERLLTDFLTKLFQAEAITSEQIDKIKILLGIGPNPTLDSGPAASEQASQ